MSPCEDRCCHCVEAEIDLLKVYFLVIMLEKDARYCSFLFLFMPHTFPALALAEQPVSLVQNGIYCICAAHDKCQQLGSVFLHGLPKGLF